MVAVVLAAWWPSCPGGRWPTGRTARTAADAAALAGAVEGEAAARRLAEANGGEAAGVRAGGDEVVVRVRVGDVEADAPGAPGRRRPPAGRARRRAAAGDRAGLAPAMLAALARADGLLGHPVPVVSGLRSRAEQQALWDRRHANPYPVARPGTSDHERGLAVDVAARRWPAVLAVAEAAGLCQPLPGERPGALRGAQEAM